MTIADHDLDSEKKIAIDDQKIADQSCLVHNWWLKPSCSHSTSPFSDWQWPNFKDKIHSNPLQYFSHHVKEWFSQNLPYPDFKISWITLLDLKRSKSGFWNKTQNLRSKKTWILMRFRKYAVNFDFCQLNNWIASYYEKLRSKPGWRTLVQNESFLFNKT